MFHLTAISYFGIRFIWSLVKRQFNERRKQRCLSKQCDIVRDILPLYVDGACSEASAEMVKEHLNACADCNAIYQKLLSHTNEDVLHEESESVIMRHEAKEKQRGRKKITIAVLVSIALCIIAIFTALFLLPINIAYEPVKIDFPFEVEDVESVEMYHYDGVPASAEKKVVVAESDIKTLYDMFKGLSLKDKTAEETAGADVTSFRFNLSDGTSYDLIYACYGAKNGNLKSESGGFAYFTSADIGSYWNNLNNELEATPVNESELPGAESAPQNDILQVGIRKATAGVYDEEGLKFTWSVENIGDYSVSFDKNMIAQIVLNGENYAFETEAVTLEPGEAYSVDISIPYPVARQDGTNNVKITATTGDTTATYKESFTH